ncbi:protein phosphatase [Marisediminicola sp. UYEF4]|uniref:PP2C family protein-serine/threonine phosphatase n=1 Tax=Marisediminicola sp. UYEF4 TaxID=1756384 RepID=UPI003396DE3A
MTQIGRSAALHSLSIPGRQGQSVGLSWGAATDIGRKRTLNEDSFLAEAPFFVVADGMGGHASGDIASAAVVRRLAEEGSADFAEPEQIMTALRIATADITLAADDDDLGVGTTATGAVLTLVDSEPYWAVFNIGDSRVYQLIEGELTQVTVDHSVVQELVDAGLLAQDEAEFHPDANIITRAVGFNAEPMADLWMLPARTGLRLLICSDGLTREVNDVALRETLNAGFGPQETATTLVDAALAAGGRDNITLVIVDVVESPDAAPLENTIPRQDAATA